MATGYGQATKGRLSASQLGSRLFIAFDRQYISRPAPVRRDESDDLAPVCWPDKATGSLRVPLGSRVHKRRGGTKEVDSYLLSLPKMCRPRLGGGALVPWAWASPR